MKYASGKHPNSHKHHKSKDVFSYGNLENSIKSGFKLRDTTKPMAKKRRKPNPY